MEKIPVELIEEICNALDHDQAALKGMRLLNKKFADAAARVLFKTLVVLPHDSSWYKVEHIAHCPRLAHWVKKLEVVPLIVNEIPESFDDWKRISQDHRVQGHLRLGDRGAAVAELVEPLDNKLAVVLKLQGRYRTWLWWVNGQEAMGQFAADLGSQELPLSLPLPALSEVEMGWPSNLWMTGPHRGRQERGGKFRPDDNMRPTDRSCNAVLNFALLYLHNSDLKITSLELHQYRDVLINNIYPVPVLTNLKHLKLHFRHQLFANQVDRGPAINRMELAPYLANAENLESLFLTQDVIDRDDDRRGPWIDLVPMLSTASWPKLRTVWFHRIFTRSDGLTQFLMKHGNSLHSIHLDRPVRHEIVWQLLASRIGTRCANCDCIISSSDDSVFRSSACVKESDFPNKDEWPWCPNDDDCWWTRWC